MHSFPLIDNKFSRCTFCCRRMLYLRCRDSGGRKAGQNMLAVAQLLGIGGGGGGYLIGVDPHPCARLAAYMLLASPPPTWLPPRFAPRRIKLPDLLHHVMNAGRPPPNHHPAGKERAPSPMVVLEEAAEEEGALWLDLAASQCQLEAIRRLHSTLDPERDYLERSACQTAAGRALWNHVIHDPLAEVFAGDVFLRGLLEKVRQDQKNKARETAGVMMAVRTLWFDARLADALSRFGRVAPGPQVVLLGAGMDARAYRLSSLKGCSVYEVDFPKAMDLKAAILRAMVDAGEPLPRLEAKSVHRVAADIGTDDWFARITAAGFNPHVPTVWILEGFLYYLQEAHAKATLRRITQTCKNETVLLADFMNESSTHLARELQTHFYFHSDWPEELLPKLGFSHVKVSQIGDADANFGLVNDELNLFNQMRRVSRHVKADKHGNPYRRLLLVETRAP